MKLSTQHQKEIEKLIPSTQRQAFLDEAVEIALAKKHAEQSDTIEIYTDGGARGNPGPAGGGFVIYKAGKVAEKGAVYFGERTNNQAEYLALREALREAYQQFPQSQVKCYLDSKLIVEQMNGNFKVKSENVRPLFEDVRRIADQFTSFTISHIPRAQNKLADQLANEAMDRKEVSSKQ